MVGGATTSNAHTALKGAPEYEAQVKLGDASLVVEAASSLTNETKKENFIAELSQKRKT